jgi:hypothetical protein
MRERVVQIESSRLCPGLRNRSVKEQESEFQQIREDKVMKKLDVLGAILVVIGALNWGLVAVARFESVAALFGIKFGEVSVFSRIV